MIEMSSTFLRAFIYNVSYHCPPESLSRTVFSISDLLPRIPSPDLSCLSNSTLSLSEPDCSLSLSERDSSLSISEPYCCSLSLSEPDCSLSLWEPDSLGTHRRCVPLRTVVACGNAPSLRTCTSRPGTHVNFWSAYLELMLTYSKGQLGCRNGVSPNILAFLFLLDIVFLKVLNSKTKYWS